MGMDLYLSPPQDSRKLWERVRDMEIILTAAREEIAALSTVIKNKDDEIKSLQVAIRSLKAV